VKTPARNQLVPESGGTSWSSSQEPVVGPGVRLRIETNSHCQDPFPDPDTIDTLI
ncbi:unnamed protein product, partial [Ilex paraguariensis]